MSCCKTIALLFKRPRILFYVTRYWGHVFPVTCDWGFYIYVIRDSFNVLSHFFHLPWVAMLNTSYSIYIYKGDSAFSTECPMKIKSTWQDRYGIQYMVNVSPGWNFVPPTGLKFCCDYMPSFSLAAVFTIGRENVHAQVQFIFQPGLKFYCDYMSLFSPGWNSLHVIANVFLTFFQEAELKSQPGQPGWARAEIRHVIGPLKKTIYLIQTFRGK